MKITCNGKEFNIKERVQIREASLHSWTFIFDE